jgi:hypothetical protein
VSVAKTSVSPLSSTIGLPEVPPGDRKTHGSSRRLVASAMSLVDALRLCRPLCLALEPQLATHHLCRCLDPCQRPRGRHHLWSSSRLQARRLVPARLVRERLCQALLFVVSVLGARVVLEKVTGGVERSTEFPRCRDIACHSGRARARLYNIRRALRSKSGARSLVDLPLLLSCFSILTPGEPVSMDPTMYTCPERSCLKARETQIATCRAHVSDRCLYLLRP